MSDGWPKMKLSEAGVILLDCDHKTPEAVEVGRPYIGIPQMTSGRIDFSTARQISEVDFVTWNRKTKYQRNDVVLSRRTNPGVTAIDDTGTEFALGQNLVLLRANGKRVERGQLAGTCTKRKNSKKDSSNQADPAGRLEACATSSKISLISQVEWVSFMCKSMLELLEGRPLRLGRF